MLSTPIIQALFQRGQFTLEDTQMTALALQCMSAGVISFMLIKVFAPGFYAQQRTQNTCACWLDGRGRECHFKRGVYWFL